MRIAITLSMLFGCSYEQIATSSTPLVSGPLACSPCNPDCNQWRNEPTDLDLTPENSGAVRWTPGPPRGISLVAESGGMVPDTDRDGVPDAWDRYPSDPGRWHEDSDAIHQTLPYFGPPTTDTRTFSAAIRAADVYFLVDTTGSMGGEIDNLQNGLTTGTIPGYERGGRYDRCGGAAVGNGAIGAIRCVIADTWFGVGSFEDYPVPPFGRPRQIGTPFGSGDFVYENFRDLTDNTRQAQDAVNALAISNGRDLPESTSQALWAMVTAGGISDRHDTFLSGRTEPCVAGDRWGYACFRPDPIPIAVVITDAHMHNGPFPAYDYGFRQVIEVPNGNHSPSTPFVVTTNLATNYVELRGDTRSGRDNVNYNVLDSIHRTTCDSDSTDHVIRFNWPGGSFVASTESRFTNYDTSLYIPGFTYSGRPFYLCADHIYPNNFWGASNIPGLGTSVSLNARTYDIYVDGRDSEDACCSLSSSGNYGLFLGNPYARNRGPTISWSQTLSALEGSGIKTIGIYSCNGPDGYGTQCATAPGKPDLEALANATDTVDAAGRPYVMSVSASGTGLSQTLVDAVYNLASSMRIDIDAIPIDNPATPAVDETQLVESITPNLCPATCAGAIFQGCGECLPDTRVDFRVMLRNDVVRPSAVPQYFSFEILVRGDGGSLTIDRIPVFITVPPTDLTYPEDGFYVQTYDANVRCEIPPTRPDWNEFIWEGTTPDSGGSSSSIVFEFQTAETLVGLDRAPIISFSVPDHPDVARSGSGVDIGTLLSRNGSRNLLPYLRVTARLLASADRRAAPTLTSFELRYLCAALE